MYKLTRVACVAAVVFSIAGSTACERKPKPLDPLTKTEKQEAERLARGDPRVAQLLGNGRVETVYVAFSSTKPQGPAGRRDPGELVLERTAEIVFYRFDGDFGVRAVVNLVQKTVVSVQRLDSSGVPMTPQDWKDALQLALNNPEINKLLGPATPKFRNLDLAQSNAAGVNGYAVRTLLIVPTGREDQCYQSRCVQLWFRPGRGYLRESAIVNLTKGTVTVERGKNP